MDLEGIVLNEVSQRKTNTLGPHLYVESNKTEVKSNRKTRFEVSRGIRGGRSKA